MAFPVDPHFDPDKLKHQAETALGDISLKTIEVLRGGPKFLANIIRCEVIGRSKGLPETVIVKAGNWPNQGLAEWATLDFLNRIDTSIERRIFPRVFGGSKEFDLVVIEDMGTVMLGNILHQSNSSTAREALITSARILGLLNGQTIGLEAEYEKICENLGLVSRRETTPTRIDRALKAIPKVAKGLGISVGTDALNDLQFCVAQVGSDRFKCLVHGDLNPGNFMVDGDMVRLCDFGRSGYSNPFVDGVYPLIYYLAHGDIGRIPEDLAMNMFEVYCEELRNWIPKTNVTDLFNSSVVVAGAGWMAYMLEDLPRCMEEDRKRGVFTYRQSMLYSLDTFSLMAEEHGILGGLANLTRIMSRTLKDTWFCQLDPIPYCRAFLN